MSTALRINRLKTLHELSGGNPGALTVLMNIRTAIGNTEFEAVAGLLREEGLAGHGSALWVGYKDYCGKDLKLFVDMLLDKDAPLLADMKKAAGL